MIVTGLHGTGPPAGESRLRLVGRPTHTPTGRTGHGTFGFSGDGGPATGAESATPDAVAAGGTGGLVAADLTTGRIRQVTG